VSNLWEEGELGGVVVVWCWWRTPASVELDPPMVCWSVGRERFAPAYVPAVVVWLKLRENTAEHSSESR
jgi:hypothetical protein